MEIIDYPSPNFFSSGGLPIRALVLHGTAGSWQSALAELTDPKPNNPAGRVSSNYLITKDGRIYRLVAYWQGKRAWANGNINNPDPLISWLLDFKKRGVNPNQATISIEHEASTSEMLSHSDMPHLQRLRSLWLCAKLLRDNHLQPGYETVIGHNQLDSVTRSACPGVISIPAWINQLKEGAQ